MTDCFALLGETRRPWLDPESLKNKFLTLSAEVHPDRVHNADDTTRHAAQARYTELNAAYNCLRDHKARLRHLLELEIGAKPKDVQEIPPDLSKMFFEVSQLCRDTDAFLAGKSKISSPLLKVQVFERSQQWIDNLSALQQKINSGHDRLLERLKAADDEWNPIAAVGSPDRIALLKRLEEIYRLLSYFGRWSAQLQERIVQLSF